MKTSKLQKLNAKLFSVDPLAKSPIHNDPLGFHTVIGGYLFVSSEVEVCDWHYYSKAWHRAYGPKKIITDRKVTIYRYNGRCKNPLQVASVVEFDGWRGNVLLSAIKSSGLFSVKKSQATLSVRLNKFYDAKLVREIDHIKIWKRTLLETHVDYCAVLNDVTYHASTIRGAVRGLHTKIKAAAKRKNSPINLKLCKDLGFCDTGIKTFCAAFNLDIHDSFSPAEIEILVKEYPKKAEPFESELRTVAKVLDYRTSI